MNELLGESLETTAPCEFLSWDSAFFGLRIGRVSVQRIDRHIAQRIVEWSRAQAIDCLYFLCDSGDPESVRTAEDHGFRLVDVRLTLARQLREPLRNEAIETSYLIRHARPADISALRTIARVSHSDSRFCFDANFPAGRCQDLFATWIERSCEGYADVVFVADIDETACGYVTCKMQSPTSGQIGLCGVAAGQRGKGLGRFLVLEALRWFSQQGATEATVVTQARNTVGQRLYQSCQFQTRSTELWYHRWARQATL